MKPKRPKKGYRFLKVGEAVTENTLAGFINDKGRCSWYPVGSLHIGSTISIPDYFKPYPQGWYIEPK